jgi:transcriptional regulator GlxA family with amidase domain
MCGRADTIATVCTGAALIAKTGLLDGNKATSNKAAWEWVVSQGEKVEWLKGARWVDTGRTITSAGVSAGIDMALALIARRDGAEVAKGAAQAIEYHWDGCSDATGWEPGQKPTMLSTPSKTASTGSRFNTPTK